MSNYQKFISKKMFICNKNFKLIILVNALKRTLAIKLVHL